MVKTRKVPGKPICSGIWYWYCLSCKKKYINNKGHSQCYRNFCRLCDINFEKDEEYMSHVMICHRDNFCENCRVCFPDLNKHVKCIKKKKD